MSRSPTDPTGRATSDWSRPADRDRLIEGAALAYDSAGDQRVQGSGRGGPVGLGDEQPE